MYKHCKTQIRNSQVEIIKHTKYKLQVNTMFYDTENPFFTSVNGSTAGLKALRGPIFNVMDVRIMFGCKSPMLISRSSKVQVLGQ